jgi:hypothetical protein
MRTRHVLMRAKLTFASLAVGGASGGHIFEPKKRLFRWYPKTRACVGDLGEAHGAVCGLC